MFFINRLGLQVGPGRWSFCGFGSAGVVLFSCLLRRADANEELHRYPRDDEMADPGDLIKEIVPDSGSGIDDLHGPAAMEASRAALAGVYEVEVHETVEEPLIDAAGPRDPARVMRAAEADVERRLRVAYRPTAPAACARVRLPRSRARERRPGCRTRRSPRGSRAGPSSDPDSSEPGEEAGRPDQATAVPS